MISSKADYRNYLLADRKANHIDDGFQKKMLITWKYLKCLRKTEYVMNCGRGKLHKLYCMLLKYRLYRLSVRSGITLPPNTFGKGLYLAHHGAIVVNPQARFGDFCVLQNGVNISEGANGGNHIYFGAGSKIMIDVHIAEDVIIGANAVVTKSVHDSNIVIAGVPATQISKHGFRNRTSI